MHKYLEVFVAAGQDRRRILLLLVLEPKGLFRLGLLARTQQPIICNVALLLVFLHPVCAPRAALPIARRRGRCCR